MSVPRSGSTLVLTNELPAGSSLTEPQCLRRANAVSAIVIEAQLFNFPAPPADYVVLPNNLFVSCGIMCGAAKR
jgi:hypothetical protein